MPNRFFSLLCVTLLTLTACQQTSLPSAPPGTNIVTVVGAIHGQHRRSEQYSLDVLRKAIVKFDPDIVMVELPPDRYETASANYEEYGEVRESRADDFPELIDVVFPLRKKLGFQIIPVAAWTQEIADDRRAAEKTLSADPSRATDWAEYQAATGAYTETVSGRSDDPLFIHSADYDAAVKARQETYERLFGDDIGAGGWQNINEAHYALVDAALRKHDGGEKRILIVYGAWHKYWFLDELDGRKDIQIFDAAQLF